nr:MAG TPA: hypothetical protein [Caudoviricetes sp.]
MIATLFFYLLPSKIRQKMNFKYCVLCRWF